MSSKISTEILSMPKLDSPYLICGLPGSGFVGKLAADYLVEQLKAIRFADMFSTSFPPQVTIQSDGTVDLVKNSLYYCKIKSHDLVLLTGDAQPTTPESEYALAEEILAISKKLDVKSIYTLAAYITGSFTKNSRVYGTSTSREVVKEFSKNGIITMSSGTITGMNGLIIGAGKKVGISGVCLLGETSGYVVDPKASKAILETLGKIIGFELDMTDLDKRIQDTEHIIKTIQAQAGQRHVGTPMPVESDDKKLGYIS